MSKERIMIIVWKWRHFERQGRVVNSDLLRHADFSIATIQPLDFNGILFDEFVVSEQRPDGTAIVVRPVAKVVRTYIENEMGDLSCSTFSFLENLIKYYKKEDTEVFVFLHRKDGFGEQEVGGLHKMKLADRCFLIGDGQGAIYYRLRNKQGLLGDNGYFYRSESRPSSPSVRVANDKEKTVYLRYFDKVWSWYKHEFYSKIFELKEDLLTHFYAIYPDEVIWSFEHLREKLGQNNILKLRVVSFIEHDEMNLSESEVKQLNLSEIEDNRSYGFDDLKANMKALDSVRPEYEKIAAMLYDYFFAEETVSEKSKSVNEVLRGIEQSFAHLLQAVKST